MELINREDPSIKLLIVGGGGEFEDKVKGVVKEHRYSDNIHLTGFKNNPVPFYLLSDLLIVVSENEGLSNAILESMACGTLVLSSRSCGASELISDTINGYLLSNTQPEVIARTILDILSKRGEELRSIRNAAESYVTRNYSIKAMLDRYIQLYNSFGVL